MESILGLTMFCRVFQCHSTRQSQLNTHCHWHALQLHLQPELNAMFSGRLVTSISSQCVHARSRKLEAVLAVVTSWSIQKESLQQVEMATI